MLGNVNYIIATTTTKILVKLMESSYTGYDITDIDVSNFEGYHFRES